MQKLYLVLWIKKYTPSCLAVSTSGLVASVALQVIALPSTPLLVAPLLHAAQLEYAPNTMKIMQIEKNTESQVLKHFVMTVRTGKINA
jgi:hypothetical protein